MKRLATIALLLGLCRAAYATGGYSGYGMDSYVSPTSCGTAGYILSTNGNCVLDWISASGGGTALLSSTNTWTSNQTFSNMIVISSGTLYPGGDGVELVGQSNGLSIRDSALQLEVARFNAGSGLFYLPHMSILLGTGLIMSADIMRSATGGAAPIDIQSAIQVSTVTFSGTSAPPNSQALCLLAGQVGHCTSVVGAGGGCTCVAP